MPYYKAVNLGTVTKTITMDEMRFAYPALRSTALRIRHQVSHRAAPGSQLLQYWPILIVKSRSVLNAPLSLQVLPEAPGNALAESESTLQSSRGAWEHL